MIPCELMEPSSLAEAFSVLEPDDAAVRPVPGGTALMRIYVARAVRAALDNGGARR